MIDVYLKILFYLFLILCIIGLTYFILKKKLNIQKKESIIEVIDYKAFGPKTGVMALKFGPKVFLLALTASSINLIEHLQLKDVGIKENTNEEIIEKIKKLKVELDEFN